MPLWAIILAAVYAIGVVILLIAIYREAPRHGTTPGILHWIVAAIWPVWVIWYCFVRISDWIESKRNGR